MSKQTLKRSIVSSPGRRSNSTRTTQNKREARVSTEQKPQIVKSVPKPRVARRRSYGFLVFLLIFILIALGGITAGAFYLWDYLESYEVSRPEHIIDYISENIDYDFWRNSVESALSKRLTHFETDAALALQPHLPLIMDVRYTIRHRPEESRDDLLVYTVRAGASDIGIIRFKPMEEAGHGFFIWGVDSMELLESFLDHFDRSITITASQNAQVEVNGIVVPEDYLIECEYDHGKTYMIHGLYGETIVKVIEFDGQVPEALFMQHDEYYFPITIPFDVDYNFIVPYGAIVYADGERVSKDNITDTMMSSQVFRRIVTIDQVPEISQNRYEFGFEYLYVEPVVIVTDAQGTELKSNISEDGEIIYKEEYSESLKADFEETAKEFMRRYITFATNYGGNPNANLAAVGNYMLRPSTLYNHQVQMINTRSFPESRRLDIHSMEADNFKQFGDKYFTCEISYSVTQVGAAGTNDFNEHYEVLFVLSGGRWLVVNML